jgi:UDP-2-acetamido-3-amino-2,3-dideoxy-glucuronate N-acetyltransferase
MEKKFFVHESSYADDGSSIGENSKIWHFCHILPGTSIGKNCILGQNVMAGPDVKIGNGCKIQNNVSIYKGVTLEDDVFCGPSTVFTNVLTPRAFVERKDEFRATLVKKGATLGANSTIICGNTLGKYCMVAAGAVVSKEVPDYALVAGVPAKQLGWVCKCGEVISRENQIKKVSKINCSRCGLSYFLSESGLKENGN